MTIIARHSYSEGASDPKARALQEALRKLEIARKALKRYADTRNWLKHRDGDFWYDWWASAGHGFEAAIDALKEIDDANG